MNMARSRPSLEKGPTYTIWHRLLGQGFQPAGDYSRDRGSWVRAGRGSVGRSRPCWIPTPWPRRAGGAAGQPGPQPARRHSGPRCCLRRPGYRCRRARGSGSRLHNHRPRPAGQSSISTSSPSIKAAIDAAVGVLFGSSVDGPAVSRQRFRSRTPWLVSGKGSPAAYQIGLQERISGYADYQLDPIAFERPRAVA